MHRSKALQHFPDAGPADAEYRRQRFFRQFTARRQLVDNGFNDCLIDLMSLSCEK
jgi:hypothetical protein